MKHAYICLIACAFLIGCEDDVILDIPEFRKGGFLSQTNELGKNDAQKLEGVWAVEAGRDLFGDSVCIQVSGDRITVYARPNVGYIIFEAGHLDSVVFLQGFWRQQVNSRTGLISTYLPKVFGGGYVLKGGKRPDTMIIVGSYGEGQENPSHDFALRWVRPFTEKALSPYLNIAHRGGGRTADRIPHSENTVELLMIAERYGANVVEIDIRLSSDRVPYLYHDVELNPRLVQRGGLVGKSESYPMNVLKNYVVLINGERIPTFEEALMTIAEKTNLVGVWLDTKSEGVGIIAEMLPVIEKARAARAKVSNVPLFMLVGLPTEEIYNEFVSLPNHKEIPSLCELSVDQARAIDARMWAPRWTLGTQDALVQEMQAEGRLCTTWTLDIDAFVEEYVNRSYFNGILTNYPTLVQYHVLMRQ